MKTKHILTIFLGTISVILCVGTLLLTYTSTKIGTFYIRTNGSPEVILQEFYDYIELQDYEGAYSCLAEYSDLGLSSELSTDNNSKIIEALQDSYRATIISDVITDGTTAKATVQFMYLDINEFQNIVTESINPLLTNYVKSMSRSEIYDENGEYSSDFLQMVYDNTIRNVIANNDDIYNYICYDVDMKYTRNGWKILINDDMIKGFLGGKNP